MARDQEGYDIALTVEVTSRFRTPQLTEFKRAREPVKFVQDRAAAATAGRAIVDARSAVERGVDRRLITEAKRLRSLDVVDDT